MLAVVKMRGSAHSTEFRAYHLTPEGARMGESLEDFYGIATGVPNRADETASNPGETAP